MNCARATAAAGQQPPADQFVALVGEVAAASRAGPAASTAIAPGGPAASHPLPPGGALPARTPRGPPAACRAKRWADGERATPACALACHCACCAPAERESHQHRLRPCRPSVASGRRGCLRWSHVARRIAAGAAGIGSSSTSDAGHARRRAAACHSRTRRAGLGIGSQAGLHRGAAGRRRAGHPPSRGARRRPGRLGVCSSFHRSVSVHFIRRSGRGRGPRPAYGPSISSRSRVRARDRRDITVPIGTPVMRATSS